MIKMLKSIAFSFGVHMCLEQIWPVLQYPVISLFCTLILWSIKDVGFNSDVKELFGVSILMWKFVFADLLKIK